MRDDIVRDFMRRIRARHPDTSIAELRSFEAELRDEHGGKRVYIKRAATIERERHAASGQATLAPPAPK